MNDDRPAALGDVQPGLHRVRRDIDHTCPLLEFPRSIEPFFHRTSRRQELILWRDQRDLPPRHHWLPLASQPLEQHARGFATGRWRVVRLSLVTDQNIGVIDHLLSHVGVMIQRDHDRNRPADNLTDCFQHASLDVVVQFGRRRAVQREEHRIQRHRRSQPVEKLLQQ